jgi:hypothetical protein
MSSSGLLWADDDDDGFQIKNRKMGPFRASKVLCYIWVRIYNSVLSHVIKLLL